MLKRFIWKKNDIYILKLTEKLFTIIQLLEAPYVAFFNIKSESVDINTKLTDLRNFKPFGVCMVLKSFLKTALIEKVKNIPPNEDIPIPEIFISKDKGQWGRPDISDDKLIYNLVRIDPNIGDQGILGNEIVKYNIDRNDAEIMSNYEFIGYNMGYALIRRLILSLDNNRWIDPLKEQRLLGTDNYPLKTVEEMWSYGVPQYEAQQEVCSIKEKEKYSFDYLSAMYNDSFYPTYLVDKIKSIIDKTVIFIESNSSTKNVIQEKLDEMTIDINKLQREFHENKSEIETIARDSISKTIEDILQFFKIDICLEDALRKRDW